MESKEIYGPIVVYKSDFNPDKIMSKLGVIIKADPDYAIDHGIEGIKDITDLAQFGIINPNTSTDGMDKSLRIAFRANLKEDLTTEILAYAKSFSKEYAAKVDGRHNPNKVLAPLIFNIDTSNLLYVQKGVLPGFFKTYTDENLPSLNPTELGRLQRLAETITGWHKQEGYDLTLDIGTAEEKYCLKRYSQANIPEGLIHILSGVELQEDISTLENEIKKINNLFEEKVLSRLRK